MIYEQIHNLIRYGIKSGLIEKEDVVYTLNRLLELFNLDQYTGPDVGTIDTDIVDLNERWSIDNNLEDILQNMLNYAVDNGLIELDSITYRDLFDTKIMSILVPRPSEVRKKFHRLYQISPQEATDYYYKFSQDTNYIRRYRIKKDAKWITKTEYGNIDITINLSKPEKDPRDIASAKSTKQSCYPLCLLCKESVGYAGGVNYPARQNHRIIPVIIHGEEWGLQYSPYVYYNEHCIVFNNQHVPMIIDQSTFRKLLSFVKQFPHYFIGSNADLPIVGGSILSHEHFQGGNYEFAMAKAPLERTYRIKGYEDVEAGIVKWPMSVLRIRCSDDNRLVELADYILRKWKCYSDETVGIYAETDGELHNTITPIARKVCNYYELDLVLRNNLCTKEHPLGVFHPHEELHHIKKENIGLIEVMGLAVLPSRLKEEMDQLAQVVLNGDPIRSYSNLVKHADWVDEFLSKYKEITPDNIQDIIKTEIGNVFAQVLHHAGVFKRNQEGMEAFERFIYQI